jgi:hypothetical protein
MTVKSTPPQKGYDPNRRLGSSGETPADAFFGFLESGARLLLWGGLIASLLAAIFLVYTYITFAGGTTASPDQAAANIAMFRKLLVAGVIAGFVGSTYLFWGEELLGALQLVGAGLLYFAPFFIPMVAGGGAVNETTADAMSTLQLGGMILGAFAIPVLVVDVGLRMRDRAKEGAKADQLKYGKGIKEERDYQNVFMGKCWQLPFCRKFVRERCPIYHSKRTCWKEKVGCMCEEEVIRNAMENRPIPKDMIAASRYIPVNNRLTLEQKNQRCRQCVIYNEHQKHKYRLSLPIVLLIFILIYAAGRPVFLRMTHGLLETLDRWVGTVTFKPDVGVAEAVNTTIIPFQEILLVCFMVVALAYTLKMIEYFIFKLKV